MNQEKIKKFLLSKCYKDPKILRKWFFQNRLFTPIRNEDFHKIGEPIELKFLEALITFCNAAEEIYSGNWDLDIRPIYVENRIHFNILGIVIHFENIDITNSVGDTHNIKDLYVLLRLFTNVVGSFQLSINGTRHTVTSKELYQGYFHSHLPSVNNNESVYLRSSDNLYIFQNTNNNNFCLGSGPITNNIRDIYEGLTDEKAVMLMLNIQALVEWESLEGRPYNNFSNVYLNSPRERNRYLQGYSFISSNSRPFEIFYKDFLNHLVESKLLKNLDMFINDQSEVIIRNENFLKDEMLRFVNITNEDDTLRVFSKEIFLVYHKPNQLHSKYKWFMKPEVNEKDLSQEDTLIEGSKQFCFNGELIKRKLIKNADSTLAEELQIIQRLQEDIHPDIYSNFKQKLQDEISKKIITKARNSHYFT